MQIDLSNVVLNRTFLLPKIDLGLDKKYYERKALKDKNILDIQFQDDAAFLPDLFIPEDKFEDKYQEYSRADYLDFYTSLSTISAFLHFIQNEDKFAYVEKKALAKLIVDRITHEFQFNVNLPEFENFEILNILYFKRIQILNMIFAIYYMHALKIAKAYKNPHLLSILTRLLRDKQKASKIVSVFEALKEVCFSGAISFPSQIAYVKKLSESYAIDSRILCIFSYNLASTIFKFYQQLLNIPPIYFAYFYLLRVISKYV